MVEADKNLAALALGGTHYGITTTESAAAYAIFGNQGVYHRPTTYYEIKHANGDTVIKYDETGEQVISPASATIMNHLLQEVVYGSEGTGSGIRGFNYNLKAYAKTGTSSESYDLWMVAGSPYYVGSVWYGFDLSHNIYNGGAAAKIWRDVMAEVHKGLEKKEFEDSEDVVKKGIGYYKKGAKVETPIYYNSSSAASSSSSPSSSSSAPSSSGSSSTVTSSENTSSSSTPSYASSDTSTSQPDTPSSSSSESSSSEPPASSDTSSGGDG